MHMPFTDPFLINLKPGWLQFLNGRNKSPAKNRLLVIMSVKSIRVVSRIGPFFLLRSWRLSRLSRISSKNIVLDKSEISPTKKMGIEILKMERSFPISMLRSSKYSFI